MPEQSNDQPFASEPCPHCGGTGRRPTPPPAQKRGGYRPPGRTHGYESTYGAGCRCAPCTAAHREGTARRRRKMADG